MGDVLLWPHHRIEINRVWPIDHDPATGIQYAMDDDTAPCELSPDPFEADALETARE